MRSLIFLLLFSSQAFAIPITYDYTGIVQTASGSLSPLQGTSVSGSFTYDPEAWEIDDQWYQDYILNLCQDGLFGGDDYELIFTSSEDLGSFDKIGRLTRELGIRIDGEAITPKGFDHFLNQPES